MSNSAVNLDGKGLAIEVPTRVWGLPKQKLAVDDEARIPAFFEYRKGSFVRQLPALNAACSSSTVQASSQGGASSEPRSDLISARPRGRCLPV